MPRCSHSMRQARGCLAALIATVAIAIAVAPPSLGAHPNLVGPDSPAQTGIPTVDRLSQALLEHDVDALVALVGYTDVPCITAPTGVPAPPFCSAIGMPQGSLAPVLPVAGCELELLLPAEVPERLALRVAADQQLYGVFVPARHPFGDVFAPGVPRPEYAVAIVNTTSPAEATQLPTGSVYYLQGGQLVAVSAFGVCGAPLPASNDPAWILPPAEPQAD